MPALIDLPQTIDPSPADQQGARSLASLLEDATLTPEADRIRAALLSVLRDMGKGRAFSIMALDEELTPNQAAQLVGVSRPFLIHLLRRGVIAYRQVGTHYRIRLSELIRYQQEQERRHSLVDDLVSDREDLGLAL